MSEQSKPQFLWVDLETTGLYPDSSVIGFGCAVEGGGFRELAAAKAEMDPYVTAMHDKNGLMQECIDSPDTLAEAEEFLCALVDGEPARSVVLAGSTVAFDRGFLVHHMPRFAGFLSHRCFDVSTLKMADRSWAGEKFKKADAHRALPDILESIAHAKEIRDRIERWSVK